MRLFRLIHARNAVHMHHLFNHSISCNVEPETRHTTPVFPYEVFAGFLGIAGFGEEHALVAGGFLFFADTAGLE